MECQICMSDDCRGHKATGRSFLEYVLGAGGIITAVYKTSKDGVSASRRVERISHGEEPKGRHLCEDHYQAQRLWRTFQYQYQTSGGAQKSLWELSLVLKFSIFSRSFILHMFYRFIYKSSNKHTHTHSAHTSVPNTHICAYSSVQIGYSTFCKHSFLSQSFFYMKLCNHQFKQSSLLLFSPSMQGTSRENLSCRAGATSLLHLNIHISRTHVCGQQPVRTELLDSTSRWMTRWSHLWWRQASTESTPARISWVMVYLLVKDLIVGDGVLITIRRSAFEEFKMIMVINKI